MLDTIYTTLPILFLSIPHTIAFNARHMLFLLDDTTSRELARSCWLSEDGDFV